MQFSLFFSFPVIYFRKDAASEVRRSHDDNSLSLFSKREKELTKHRAVAAKRARYTY